MYAGIVFYIGSFNIFTPELKNIREFVLWVLMVGELFFIMLYPLIKDEILNDEN
jgi:hypothetical protein